MDKTEYRLKLDEINQLAEEQDYEGAMAVAESIEWRRVKSVRTLCLIADIYEINGNLEKSMDMLRLAYKRSTIGKTILYRQVELALKMKKNNDALKYYNKYVDVASRDTSKYILKYKIYKAQNAPLDDQIAILEDYKDKEYTERWVYELAKLYKKAGNQEKCVETCDDLILWFGEGKYVTKAMELKMAYEPLSPEQQKKYDSRDLTEEEESNSESLLATASAIKGISAAVLENLKKTPILPIEKSESEDTKEVSDEMSEAAITTEDAVETETQQEKTEDEKEQKSETEEPEAERRSDDVEEEKKESESEETNIDQSEEKPEKKPEETIKEPKVRISQEQLKERLAKSFKEVLSGLNRTNVVNTLENPASLFTKEDMERFEEEEENMEGYHISNLEPETIHESVIQADETSFLTEKTEAPEVEEEAEKPEKPEDREITSIDEIDLDALFAETSNIFADEIKSDVEETEVEEDLNSDTEKNELVEEPEDHLEAVVAYEEPETEELETVEEPKSESLEEPETIEEPEEIEEEIIEQEEEVVEEPEIVEEPEEIEEEIIEQEEEAVEEPETIEEPEEIEEEIIEQEETAEEPETVEEGVKPEDKEITSIDEIDLDALFAETSNIFANEIKISMEEAEKEKIIEQEEEVVEEPETVEEPEEIEEEIIEQEEEVVEEPETVEEPEEIEEEIIEQEEEVVEEPETVEEPEEIEEEIIKQEEEVVEEPEEDLDELAQELRAMLSQDIEEKAEEDISDISETSFEEVSEEDQKSEKSHIDETLEQLARELGMSEEPEMIEEEPDSEEDIQEPEEDLPEEEIQIENIPVDNSVPEEISEAVEVADHTDESDIEEAGKKPKENEEFLEIEEALEDTLQSIGSISVTSSQPEQEENDHPAVEEKEEETSQETSVEEEDGHAFQALDEQLPDKLSDAQKALFSYFSKVPGMNEQILDAINGVYVYADDKTSNRGNIAVMGSHGTGKTRLTEGLVKAICQRMGMEAAKFACIDASDMNKKNPATIISKMSGGFLLIERASFLTPEIVERLSIAMGFRTDSMVLIIEDDKARMRRFLAANPEFAKKFETVISIPVFTNDELVTFARTYAKENGYKMDDMGVLALYTLIGDNQTDEEPITIGKVKEMVDKAIRNANRRHLRRKFSKRHTDPTGRILLYEKDFDE